MDPGRKARIIKTLGNPHRLVILEKLVSCCEPGTVCEMNPESSPFVSELGQGLGIAPSTLSHHLKELAQAGLIRTQRRGKNVACWVDPEMLAGMAEYFNGLLGLEQGESNVEKSDQEIRQFTLERYRDVALAEPGTGCCGPQGCCGPAPVAAGDFSARVGYSEEELAAAPEGADLGLGCGNPQAIAALSPGEDVLDLGSGGGFDCFLAARQVGPGGRVIGVDMTPEMVARARDNAARTDLDNVEFRLGEIEHLPVADGSVDVIMSNCVINLSPDKPAVYREAFRALRPGGRLAVSDIVATAEMPDEIKADLALWAGCAAGASLVGEVEAMLDEAGFTNVRVVLNKASREVVREWAPGRGIEDYVVSASIEAVKPAG